ncbi:uncharacterized protein VP01_7518g1, partial [Puccinia sorghi]
SLKISCYDVGGKQDYHNVYVDDMINIIHDVDRFKMLISKKFRMEDLVEASYILGIKLTRLDSSRMTLSQENYTDSILER